MGILNKDKITFNDLEQFIFEIKVGTMYEGWKDTAGKRSTLANKTVAAGIERSESFHEKWEAKIQSVYDPEMIGVRIFNGDGGSWVRDEYDADAIRRLDRFRVTQTIRQKISHEEMKKQMQPNLKNIWRTTKMSCRDTIREGETYRSRRRG